MLSRLSRLLLPDCESRATAARLRSRFEPWACLALWPCAEQKGRGRTSHPFSKASSIDAGVKEQHLVVCFVVGGLPLKAGHERASLYRAVDLAAWLISSKPSLQAWLAQQLGKPCVKCCSPLTIPQGAWHVGSVSVPQLSMWPQTEAQ